jgi:hypothetical protein
MIVSIVGSLWWEESGYYPPEGEYTNDYIEKKYRDSLIAIFGYETGRKMYDWILTKYKHKV